MKPDLPFVPGSEVAGVVSSAPDGSALNEGDRVAAFCALGGFAEAAVAPEWLTFPLPEGLDYAQGAGLILNYHTAYFALVTRGRLAEGETVLVHGAAGGVGSAALQVAKGLGGRTIAVVSTDEKAKVAGDAGADEVLRSDEPWRDRAKEALRRRRGRGHRSCRRRPLHRQPALPRRRRALRGGGLHRRLDPEVRVNRLLLNNVDVVGARLGGLRAGQAGGQSRDRCPNRPPGGERLREADRGRSLPARAGGRRARADRLPRSDRKVVLDVRPD